MEIVVINCPHCGKAFVKNTLSIYKHTNTGKTVYYCGYNCWRANDTRRDGRRKQ